MGFVGKHIPAAVFILLSQLAGIVGSFFTVSALADWYAFLNKPAFNPPDWIFGPVWVTLYTMMGLAAYLVWLKRDEQSIARPALIFFAVHLLFNSLWSIIFFGLQNLWLAFGEIMILWIMIAVLIKLFYRIDKRSAYLMLPYLLWVSFAMLLNFSLWQLN